ncbi:MAG: hypothetical protein HY682_00965 [Chloroflexi bacterium]|nr:hypothetical protein [Chloroflexota bacterium]
MLQPRAYVRRIGWRLLLGILAILALIALAACARVEEEEETEEGAVFGSPTAPVAAPGGGTPVGQPTETPAAGEKEAGMVEVDLKAEGDFGQDGKATFKADDDKTIVTIEMESGEAGMSQPAHIHKDSCAAKSDIEFPLENVVDGKSETTLDVSFDDLFGEERSINVHKSEDEADVIVACGDLEKGGAMPQEAPPGGATPEAPGGGSPTPGAGGKGPSY